MNDLQMQRRCLGRGALCLLIPMLAGIVTGAGGPADKALDIMREVERRVLTDSQSYEGAIEVVDANNAQFGAGVAAVSEELNVQVAALKLSKAIGEFGIDKLERKP